MQRFIPSQSTKSPLDENKRLETKFQKRRTKPIFKSNVLILPNEREGMKIFSDFITSLSDEEMDDMFEAMKTIRGKDLSFSFDNLTVYNDYVIIENEGKKYGIVTDHAYLELERIRKNKILRNNINKTVKVTGVVGSVKLYSNSALFCLSPCIINGTDIGHTWTRYAPEFKNIRYGSTVSFYSEIKKYGEYNSKSGVNWQEVSFVRMKGGDNSQFYEIPAQIKNVSYINRPGSARAEFNSEIGLNTLLLTYRPGGRETFTLKRLRFRDYNGVKIAFNTFEGKLVLNSKYITEIDKTAQDTLDSLLFFEWMTKIEDWEFWGYTRRTRNDS